MRHGADGQRCRAGKSHIRVWCVKTWRDTLGVSNPSPRLDRAVQGSITGKRKPRKLWLEITVGVRAMEETASYSGESL